MTTENKTESINESDPSTTVMVFLIRFIIVVIVVGVCALFGKLFYGLTDASKESIAEAAEDDCMKAHILSYRAENGAINKSTLWDYKRDCELQNEYKNQVEVIREFPQGYRSGGNGIPTIDIASTVMPDGKINTDKIREFCGKNEKCFNNINKSASELSFNTVQEQSEKELTRSLFNINMVFIEVIRHSGNAKDENKELTNLLENGCAMQSIRDLVLTGYNEKDIGKIHKAHICAEKLAVALGYRG